MAAKATTGQQSENVRRAEARITGGRAYTQASIKRLAEAGVNIGALLAKTPGRGLPGAQAGAAQTQAQQLRYRARNEQQIAKLRQQTHLLALKHAYELVKQHRQTREQAPLPYSRNV